MICRHGSERNSRVVARNGFLSHGVYESTIVDDEVWVGLQTQRDTRVDNKPLPFAANTIWQSVLSGGKVGAELMLVALQLSPNGALVVAILIIAFLSSGPCARSSVWSAESRHSIARSRIAGTGGSTHSG